ncbi:hypothetical protein DL767_000853 [Monosporascus sp. MG133]|nr:hypothetical protein DL767_000853 [Monosporascus sp. MG133]
MFAMLGGRLSLHIFSRKEKAGATAWISTSAIREQERMILMKFFNEIHSAVPLFEKERFIRLYDSCAVRRDLIVTMAAVTAKILGPIDTWSSFDLDLCLNSLLASPPLREGSDGVQTDLDSFRQECLLAYYDFHQFPGASSCMRIARLTRKAYAVGLHQIENPGLCSAFQPKTETEDVIEDWRYVWWCVYCFDSYSNISAGTPFIVDEESINTALPRRPFNQDVVSPWTVSSPKVFLPDGPSELWEIAQKSTSYGDLSGFNIHIVTATMLRNAGAVLRLRSEKGPGRHRARIADLKRSLASLRLALPPRYLNPTRNVLKSEVPPDHHVRLTNILHLHMARIMLCLPGGLSAGEEEWMEDWQQTLEASLDIVRVVEQWDSQFSAHVDPAICFIVFLALAILNLHRRSSIDESSELATTISQSETILMLFLEHFSSLWTLPKFLARVYRDWQAVHTHRLTPARIEAILNHIKPPLHPKFGRTYRDTIEQHTSAPIAGPDLALGGDLWNPEEMLIFTL